MLITCDTDLRKYLPNALATVEGESSLYDKLDFFLAASERWLAEHFTGTTVLVEISAMDAALYSFLRSMLGYGISLEQYSIV